jgi:CHAT domain-containing protein/tetratricopeptide (TPR) repeat protein
VAGRIVSLLEDWRGKQHQDSVSTRQDMKMYQALSRLPAAEQREVGKSFKAEAEGQAAGERKQFAAAEDLHRQALALRNRILGKDHLLTATSCTSIAENLYWQGKFRDAQPLYERALIICRKVLGEEHPRTASYCANVAIILEEQGKYMEAQPLYREALAICLKVHGEESIDTASAYSNVGHNLFMQGKYADGQRFVQKSLAITRKLRGEHHRDTAYDCNNLARCLFMQGKYAEAQPLYEKALVFFQTLGEDDPDVATAFNNLAENLAAQGKYVEAQRLYEKGLDIRRRVLKEKNPFTAVSYSSLASNFQAQGNYEEAQRLYVKALAIRREVLREGHPHIAISLNELAFNLSAQGKQDQARELAEEALAINRKELGEDHPETALTYVYLATILDARGESAKAQPLFARALATNRRVLGEEHPRTAATCTQAAVNRWRQGEIAEAVRLLQESLPGQEAARLGRAPSGFDRAVAVAHREVSPHFLLAVGLARLGQPADAFRRAEAGLARGLLDDWTAPGSDAPELDDLRARLDQLDEKFLPLFGRTTLSADQKALRDELSRQRRETLTRMARLAAATSERQVQPLADVQKQVPDDAALVLWLDLDKLGEHHACVVRSRGAPAWERLSGSGKDGSWTGSDLDLPDRLYRLLQKPSPDEEERQRLSADLARQRLGPLRPHLAAHDGLPAVRHLLVVPTGWAGHVPLEVLTADYRISYVPSGTVYARLRRQHRPVQGTSLLALGAPAFGSRPPDPSAIVQRGPDPVSLPGTRWEVEILARLVPKTTPLVGSDASEQRLDELAGDGRLRDYRLVHLATHGVVDEQTPARSRLLLARDRLPRLRDTAPGRRPYTGELTVGAIRESWKLDADVVTLSACKTALGRQGHGDGLLGFAQAFLQCGARSVVLSRWAVEDTATALLMLRFYENLLGARKELKAALPRAQALEEARRWLRELPRQDVKRLASALVAGKLSGTTRGEVVELNVQERPVKLPAGDRPYAHPFFWAAFVLVGDPE